MQRIKARHFTSPLPLDKETLTATFGEDRLQFPNWLDSF
jgi:hypothetical protein